MCELGMGQRGRGERESQADLAECGAWHRAQSHKLKIMTSAKNQKSDT